MADSTGSAAERWQTVRSAVEEALLLPAAERLSFLRDKIKDANLRVEAEQLLNLEKDASEMFAVDGWRTQGEGVLLEKTSAGTMIGSYRVLEEIGRGGMGTVYLAERADGVYEQRVALKVLQEHISSTEMDRRFRAERQILAALAHPGIARLLDGGVMPGGRPYLVLEYVKGRAIDVYCDEEKLGFSARISLFLKVAEAVQAAHQQLVLHLDVKPANILISDDGEPHLLDFGIARFLSAQSGEAAVVQPSVMLMTPRYASPEQTEGKPLGVASDVFSLATLLYRLLTGMLPYPLEGASVLDIAAMIREASPLTPSKAAPPEVAPSLRGDLDMILLQALRKEPERRYPTVAAFAADIERHLQSRPVLAHKDSLTYRAGKFFRRHRGAVAAATVIVIVITVSVTLVVRSAVIARRERAAAERRLKDVRALAHSYVFDLDKMLIGVPGTLNVRALVLQNATRYLESMSKESVDDEDLARELAEGYIEIGRVQATPGQPSMSDWKAAGESQSKGIAIERKLLAKHPDNLADRIQLVRQLVNLSQVYEFTNDISRREETALEAWELGQPILAAGPMTKRYLVMAGAAEMLARLRAGNGDDWNMSDPVGAQPWIDRSEAIIEKYQTSHLGAPGYSVLQARQTAAASRAMSATQMGDDKRTRRLFEDALKIPMPSLNGQSEDQGHKVLRELYAVALLDMGDVASAEGMIQNPAGERVHEKVHDRLLAGDDADELLIYALIDLRRGRVKEAQEKMQRSLKVTEKMYADDPTNEMQGAGLASTLLRLADEPALDQAERKQFYQRSRAMAERFLAKEPEAMAAAIAMGRCELGLARLARAEHEEAEAAARAAAAVRQFEHVLSARPVHPRAAGLLRQAKTFSAN